MSRPTLVLALLAGCTYLGADSLDRDEDGVVDYEDCDFRSPEGAAGSAMRDAYRDLDGDGFGDPLNVIALCETAELPQGVVSNALDCNDADDAIHPAAYERCVPSGVDDDCDGAADDSDPERNFGPDALRLFADPDEDGHPSNTDPVPACEAGPGELILAAGEPVPAVDCGPNDPSIYPGATEVPYNGIDEDCDLVDIVDVDGDGYNAEAAGGSDCDDNDPSVFPSTVYYLDTDGDLSPDSFDPVSGCALGAGYVVFADATLTVDCSPLDATIHPLAVENPYDGIDDNCDLEDANDLDGDGFISVDAVGVNGTDCDDTRDDVYPGAIDLLYDGLDANCDGSSDFDADSDGFDSFLYGGTDCDDTAVNIFPNAPPLAGTDANCNGVVEVACFLDVDGDGQGNPLIVQSRDACEASEVPQAGDCDDSNPSIYDGAPERCGDGDTDCDGVGDARTITVIGPNDVVLSHTPLALNSTVPVDASGAVEVSICSEPGYNSVHIDVGTIDSSRSVWIHGAEIGSKTLTDSIIEGSANQSGFEPHELLIEDLSFDGSDYQTIIDIDSTNDDTFTLRLHDVDYTSAQAESLVDLRGGALDIASLDLNYSGSYGPLIRSTGRATLRNLDVYGHDGQLLDLTNGIVSDAYVYNTDSSNSDYGDLITLRGNAVLTNVNVGNHYGDPILYVTYFAVVTVADSAFDSSTTYSAPIVVDGVLNLVGSDIQSNTGFDSGGIAANPDSLVTVNRSNLRYNTSYSGGGAISVTDSLLWVSGSSFEFNTASSSGGNIEAVRTPTVLSNSYLAYGTAGGYGGGASIRGSATLLGLNEFDQNSAGLDGGGLYLLGELTADTLYGSQNSAEYGGFVWQSDGSVSIEYLQTTNNFASWQGHGLWLEYPPDVSFDAWDDNTTTPGVLLFVSGNSSVAGYGISPSSTQTIMTHTSSVDICPYTNSWDVHCSGGTCNEYTWPTQPTCP